MSSSIPPPLVSVIIVSWNARDYLCQCLESLSDKVCAYPMEIIVVDNASTDGSPESVEKHFPQVQLIRNAANFGFAKANNIGFAQSRGRYLAFINSDVKVLKDCLTHLVNFCEHRPEVALVGPRVIGRDGKLQRTCRGFPTVWNIFCRAMALDIIFPRTKLFAGHTLSYWSQETLESVDILGGCFWLARREALVQVGLLDESFFMYGEDMDWCKRFWKEGWKLFFVPTAEAIHYGGGSSANAPVRFFIERQRADLQYWKKHHSHAGFICYFVISCLQLMLRAIGFGFLSYLSKMQQQACRHKVERSLACLRWMFFGKYSDRTVKVNLPGQQL